MYLAGIARDITTLASVSRSLFAAYVRPFSTAVNVTPSIEVDRVTDVTQWSASARPRSTTPDINRRVPASIWYHGAPVLLLLHQAPPSESGPIMHVAALTRPSPCAA